MTVNLMFVNHTPSYVLVRLLRRLGDILSSANITLGLAKIVEELAAFFILKPTGGHRVRYHIHQILMTEIRL